MPGETVEDVARRDPRAAAPILDELGATLRVMHQHRGPRFGKLALVSDPTVPSDRRTCEGVVLDRALADLAEAASRVDRLAAVRDRLAEVTRELAAAVRPRREYGLIHGELGPDHVLVDGHDHPVIIDIEGLMFFDVEWEHAFMRFRFGEHYRALRREPDSLDDRRIRFYTLALRLSLVTGPLRLLDGDYPERELMREIAEANVDRALAFLA